MKKKTIKAKREIRAAAEAIKDISDGLVVTNGKARFTDPHREAQRRKGEAMLENFMKELGWEGLSPEAKAMHRLNLKAQALIQLSLDEAEAKHPGFKQELETIYRRMENLSAAFNIPIPTPV